MSNQPRATPWVNLRIRQRPERAKAQKPVSIRQYIPFIIIYMIEFQELYILFSKCLFLMVFLLIINISNYIVNLRLTYRKGCVASLPCKFLINRCQRLYPSTTVPFHLLYEVRHCFCL